MGTRNLTMVLVDGDIKVSQYCQWDGGLSSKGQDVVNFIKQDMVLDKFKEAVKNCQYASDDFYEKNEINLENNPEFSRDTGPAVLTMIQDKGVRLLSDNRDFAADSLFCEWAYLIDLDRNVLEIYRGFQKKPLDETDRFYHLTSKKHNPKLDKYYPIKLMKTLSFKEVKEKTFQTILEEYEVEAERRAQLEELKS